MLWGDFLFRNFKREINFLSVHIGMIGFSAFLCCFGGILLWVNGTGLWRILHTGQYLSGSASVTGIFLLWLFTYGLCGTSQALLLLRSRFCRNSRGLTEFSVCCVIYLLQLVWYAVFFCSHLLFFAFIILLLTFLLTLILLFLVRKGFLLLKLLLVTMTLVELYFIYFNLTFYLG